jgi:hypothetical protein
MQQFASINGSLNVVPLVLSNVMGSFVRQKLYIVASNPVAITIDTEELDSGI